MASLEHRLLDCLPNLRRYARALMRGDVLAADDLVQDCIERALSHRHRWRAGSDLRAWLFTIMHNVYVNQIRRLSNGPQFVGLQDSGESLEMSGNAEQDVALRDLSRALARLSPEQREILLLVTLEGLRYREVAAILGMPEGTVMSKLSRARQHLRDQLEEDKTRRLRRVK